MWITWSLFTLDVYLYFIQTSHFLTQTFTNKAKVREIKRLESDRERDSNWLKEGHGKNERKMWFFLDGLNTILNQIIGIKLKLSPNHKNQIKTKSQL